MKLALSRKQRAAASGFAMLLITVLALILFHYGRQWGALAFEGLSLATYSIWVSLGKEEDIEDEYIDPDEE